MDKNGRATRMSDFRLGDDVLLQVVENEVLLYDPRAKKVHLASPEVAEILRGLSSDHERHAQEFLSPREEELLAELEEKGLVVSETVDKTSRRGFLMGAGKSVAALAAVTTLSLPQPAAASSTCILNGDTNCAQATCNVRCNDSGGTDCPDPARLCRMNFRKVGTGAVDESFNFCAEFQNTSCSDDGAMAYRDSCADARNAVGNNGTYRCCRTCP
jgi:hypothetical protein